MIAIWAFSVCLIGRKKGTVERTEQLHCGLRLVQEYIVAAVGGSLPCLANTNAHIMFELEDSLEQIMKRQGAAGFTSQGPDTLLCAVNMPQQLGVTK